MRGLTLGCVLLVGCHLVWPFDEVSRTGDGAVLDGVVPPDGTPLSDGTADRGHEGPSGDGGPSGCKLVKVFADASKTLRAVQGSGAEVWIVGSDGLTLHLAADGQWHEGVAGNQDLRGLWLQSAQEGWAVGSSSTIQRLQGGIWSAGTTDAAIPQVQLNAIWGSSTDDLWAVGSDDATGYVLRYVPAQDLWQTAATSDTAAYYGVWGPSAAVAWAVGTNGGVLRHDTLWTTQVLPPGVETGNDLRAIWGPAAGGEFFVVGDSGTILYHKGGGWTAQTSSQLSVGLSAVHGRAASDVWAVGNGGTVLRQEGGAWKLVPSGIAEDLNGVWVSPDKPCDGWIVGDSGARLRIAPGP